MSAPAPEHRLAFFRGFLEKPKEVGSIIPSSRFLEKRIVRVGDVASADVVIELGPGTGGTTRALLAVMKPDSKLLAIEINPHFAKLLSRNIRDPRLIVHEGSAADIGEARAAHDLPAADVILSGIPFSTMDKSQGLEILRCIERHLSPEGRFVAYQFRDRVEALGRQVFGPARVQTELRNVPPMRVYRWNAIDARGASEAG